MKDNSRKRTNGTRKHNYAARPAIVQKRKDRNVRRSSHGKFQTVSELVAYAAKKANKQ
jgi:hypothetical protein